MPAQQVRDPGEQDQALAAERTQHAHVDVQALVARRAGRVDGAPDRHVTAVGEPRAAHRGERPPGRRAPARREVDRLGQLELDRRAKPVGNLEVGRPRPLRQLDAGGRLDRGPAAPGAQPAVDRFHTTPGPAHARRQVDAVRRAVAAGREAVGVLDRQVSIALVIGLGRQLQHVAGRARLVAGHPVLGPHRRQVHGTARELVVARGRRLAIEPPGEAEAPPGARPDEQAQAGVDGGGAGEVEPVDADAQARHQHPRPALELGVGAGVPVGEGDVEDRRAGDAAQVAAGLGHAPRPGVARPAAVGADADGAGRGDARDVGAPRVTPVASLDVEDADGRIAHVFRHPERGDGEPSAGRGLLPPRVGQGVGVGRLHEAGERLVLDLDAHALAQRHREHLERPEGRRVVVAADVQVPRVGVAGERPRRPVEAEHRARLGPVAGNPQAAPRAHRQRRDAGYAAQQQCGLPRRLRRPAVPLHLQHPAQRVAEPGGKAAGAERDVAGEERIHGAPHAARHRLVAVGVVDDRVVEQREDLGRIAAAHEQPRLVVELAHAGQVLHVEHDVGLGAGQRHDVEGTERLHRGRRGDRRRRDDVDELLEVGGLEHDVDVVQGPVEIDRHLG